MAINNLGVNHSQTFTNAWYAGPGYDLNLATWWEDYSCAVYTHCREFFPRMVGDFNGDGYADFLGFDQTNMVYQPSTYVTQFK